MATLTTTADEVQALLQLVQRISMSRAEALFTEALFSDWLTQLAAAGGAPATDVLAPTPTDQHIAGPYQPLPAGAPSTKPIDQVQSP